MTQVFNYSVYETDYITQWLRRNEDAPPWFKDYLLGTSTTEQNRDDDLEDYLSAQTYVPSLTVTRASPQAINDITPTLVSFDAIDFQSTGLFDWTAGAPSRVIATDSGIVQISGNIKYAASAGGNFRTAQLFVNGIDINGGSTISPIGGAGDPQCLAFIQYNIISGDYIELVTNQDSGAPLNMTAARLSMSFLGAASG